MAIEKISKKDGPSYRAVFCKNRKRISQCFARKIDAQQWLEEQAQIHQFGFKPKLKFSEAAQIWLDNHSRIRKAPSSYSTDKRMVKLFVKSFGELNLDQISPEHVEHFISKRLANEVKASTVNRHLQCLRAILFYFIKKRYIITNVVSSVGLLPEAEISYDYLSFDEANQFLAYTKQKYQSHNSWIYRLYLLAINTGMRWGEIVALKWDRVDFSNKRITISRTYCKQSRQIRETTKGRKIRYVGINSSLLPELLKQYEERDRSTNLVFSREERIPDLESFKRNRYNVDLKKAGLRKIRFHDLRHTFASHFMMNGGNLYDLQKLLGHSEISTTERYAHLSPESLIGKTELVAIDGGNAEIIPIKEQLNQTA